MTQGLVIAVSKSATHSMVKTNQDSIDLEKSVGVKGDAHSGKFVKHVYLAKKTPEESNLRQVHLIQVELYKELVQQGFDLSPGFMGENITTNGIDLLKLPENTVLKLGNDAEVKITGLRTPCNQLNGIQKGLMKAVLIKDEQGNAILKSGVMAVVTKSGRIYKNDAIEVVLPNAPHVSLKPV